jgi:hypothetical protein
MPKWVPTTKPSAPLTAVEPEPTLEDDGRMTQLFQTVNGKRFIEVVYPTGFVLWLQEVTQ